jgi:hypothetical protein
MSKMGEYPPIRGRSRERLVFISGVLPKPIRSRAAAVDGGASRDRTGDLKLAKLALSQLSYGPIRDLKFTKFTGAMAFALVGRGGVEPPTSRLSGVRSNHLSYRPPSPANPAIGPQAA